MGLFQHQTDRMSDFGFRLMHLTFNFIMERGMLLGIKERAETLYQTSR
jgi:hypothetical protein